VGFVARLKPDARVKLGARGRSRHGHGGQGFYEAPALQSLANTLDVERADAQLPDALFSQHARLDEHLPVVANEREADAERFSERRATHGRAPEEGVDDVDALRICQRLEDLGALLGAQPTPCHAPDRSALGPPSAILKRLLD
jgi:hypothetical protein